MFTYSQPDFYHFSDDSVLLAEFAALSFDRRDKMRCADFFCGCGVVGLEFIQRYLDVDQLDFWEKEESFQSHFEDNRLRLDLLSPARLQWHCADLLCDFPRDEQYDLILANPPFFDAEANRPALKGGPKRAMARSWNKESREQFVKLLCASLKEDAKAYILLRNDQSLKATIETCSQLLIVGQKNLGVCSILEICLNVDRYEQLF